MIRRLEMGKMKEIAMQEEQMELFALDGLDYSEYDVNVDFEFVETEYDGFKVDSMISFDEFNTEVSPIDVTYDYSDVYSRDWIMWEETKPLTSTSETDILRNEIADLTKSLYAQYERVKELLEENDSLKAQIENMSTTKVYTNTRKF